MKNKRHRSLNFVVSMTLFTVFALFMMLVLLMGASAFKGVSARAEERYAERTPLLYASQKLRSADWVTMTVIDDTPVLVLGDTSGNTRVYLYLYGGYVTELFVFGDTAPNFEIGTQLFPAESLEFALLTPTLISVAIDGSCIFVNLASEVGV